MTLEPRRRRRHAGVLHEGCRAGAVAALTWLLGTTPLAAVDYYRTDRFGTPLALLDGAPGSGAGTVLAVDTAAEAAAAGLVARRRLLNGGETVHEWRRTDAGGGSLEQELEQGRVVAERRYDAAGLLLEERHFSATGALKWRDVLAYRGASLHQVQSYDAAGALLATDRYELTAAGRLRRFTRVPASGPNGIEPSTVLSLVFRRGDLIEERHGTGDAELIVRSAAGSQYAREQWAGERVVAEHRSPRAAAGELATETSSDRRAGTRNETTYDAGGRPVTERVYALPDAEGDGSRLLEERSYRYHADGSLAFLEVAGERGIETYDYRYDAAGRLIREQYRRRGRVVRVTTFPAPGEQVDEVYSADDTVLRVFWRDQVRQREELLRDGAVIRTRDPAPPEAGAP